HQTDQSVSFLALPKRGKGGETPASELSFNVTAAPITIPGGISRFSIKVNGHGDFPLSVSLAARTGNFGQGARAFKNFSSGHSPTKFSFAPRSNLHFSRKDPILGLITIISVACKSDGELCPHHCTCSIPNTIQVMGLVQLFIICHFKGIKSPGYSHPVPRTVAWTRINFKQMLRLNKQTLIRHLYQPPLTTPPQTGLCKCDTPAE